MLNSIKQIAVKYSVSERTSAAIRASLGDVIIRRGLNVSPKECAYEQGDMENGLLGKTWWKQGKQQT